MAIYSSCSNPLLRWAVLKHITAEGAHWDVMLEPAPGEKLLTWRVDQPPTQWLCAQAELPATRIGDHRSVYLTYEGEISGNRGHVAREASGTWRPAEISDTTISGQLTGGMKIQLMQINADQWRLTILKSVPE